MPDPLERFAGRIPPPGVDGNTALPSFPLPPPPPGEAPAPIPPTAPVVTPVPTPAAEPAGLNINVNPFPGTVVQPGAAPAAPFQSFLQGASGSPGPISAGPGVPLAGAGVGRDSLFDDDELVKLLVSSLPRT